MIDVTRVLLIVRERWRAGVAALFDPTLPGSGAARKSATGALIRDYWPFYGLVFLVGTENFVVSPFIPAIATDLGNSVEALATMVTAYALTYAITAPAFGNVSDWLGRRPLIVAGASILLTGNLLVAGAPSLRVLLAARAVTGLGAAMAGPAIWAHIADTSASGVRGRAMGLGMGAFSLGQVIGVPLGGAVAGLANWRWAFSGLGLLVLPLLLVIGQALPSTQARAAPKPAISGALVLFTIWRSPAVRLALLVSFLFHAGNLGSYTYLGALYSRYFDLSTAEIGLTGILVGGGSLLGSLLGGKINDRWLARGGNGAQLAMLWALLLGVTILLATSPLSLPLSLLVLILWFLASGAFVTTQQTLLTLAAPTMRATAVSWNNSIMHVGAGVGVWVMGMGLRRGLSVSAMGCGFGLAAAACAAVLARSKSPLSLRGDL